MSHTPANSKKQPTMMGFFKKTPASNKTSNGDNITPLGNIIGGEAGNINNNNDVPINKDMNNQNPINNNVNTNNDSSNSKNVKKDEQDAVEKNMEALVNNSSGEGSPKTSSLSSSSSSEKKTTTKLEIEDADAEAETEVEAKEVRTSKLFSDTNVETNKDEGAKVESMVETTEDMQVEEENEEETEEDNEDAKIYIPPPGQSGLTHRAMEDASSSPVASPTKSKSKSNKADEAYTSGKETTGDGASEEAVATYMAELEELEEEEDLCDKNLDIEVQKEKVVTASLVYHDTTATDEDSKQALIEALSGLVASVCQGRDGVSEEISKQEMETELTDLIKEIDEDQKAFSFYNDLGFDSFKEKIGMTCQKYTNKSTNLVRWEVYAAAIYFPQKLSSRINRLREWRKAYAGMLDACTTTMTAREAREAAISDKEVKSKQKAYDNSLKALNTAFTKLDKKKTLRNEKKEKEEKERRDKEEKLRLKEIEKEAKLKGKQKEEEAKKKKLEEDKLAKEAAKNAKDAEKKAKEAVREAEKKRKDAEKQAKEAEKKAKEDAKQKEAEEKEAAEKLKKEKNKKFFSGFFAAASSPAVSRSNAATNQVATSSASVSSSFPFASTGVIDKRPVAADEFEKELSSSISHTKILENLRERYQKKVSVECRSTLALEVTIVDSNAFNAAERDQLVTKEFDPYKRYLYFSESRRPAYYGTYSKTSKHITGRNPLGKDEELDYEDDSADEWSEEGGDGDSLGDDALLSDEEGGHDYECDDFLKAEGDFGSDAGSDNEDLVAARMSSGIEEKNLVGPRFMRFVSNIPSVDEKDGENSATTMDIEDMNVYVGNIGKESYDVDSNYDKDKEGSSNLHYQASSVEVEDYVSYDGDDEQCEKLLQYRARIYNTSHLPQLVAGVELEPSDGLDEKKVKEDLFTDCVKGQLAKHVHGKKDGIDKLIASFLASDDDYNGLSKQRIKREIKAICKTGQRIKHELGHGNPRWVVDLDLSTQQKCGITPPLGEVEFSPAKPKKAPRKRKTDDATGTTTCDAEANADAEQPAVVIPPPGSSGLASRAAVDALPETAASSSSSSRPPHILKARKKKVETPNKEKESVSAKKNIPSSTAIAPVAASGTGTPTPNVLVPRKKAKSTPEAEETTTTSASTPMQKNVSSTPVGIGSVASAASVDTTTTTTINQLIPKPKPKPQ